MKTDKDFAAAEADYKRIDRAVRTLWCEKEKAWRPFHRDDKLAAEGGLYVCTTPDCGASYPLIVNTTERSAK